MIAARLSSALRGIGRQTWQEHGAQTFDRLFPVTRVPLPQAIDAPRHEIATADAGTISYYADTSVEGRPLVLLHGIHAAASAYDMRPLFESFRGVRPVYALDLPGYGFSERAARTYKPETFVHAIEHLLRNVAMNQGADVIALSLTSEYVAKVAIEMPELVRSLVLISPTGFGSAREQSRLQRRARKADKKRVQWLSTLPSNRVLFELLASKPSIRFFLRKSFEGRVDEGMFAYAYATSHQEGAWRAPMAFIAGSLFPAGSALNTYARVRTPTLVLYDQDPHTGFGELDAFAAEHTNFVPLRIPHTRGLPHYDAPEQTAEALRTFFARPEQRAGAQRDGGAHNVRFIGSA